MLRFRRKPYDNVLDALPPVVEARDFSPHLQRDLNLRVEEDFLSTESIRVRKLPQGRLF